ncbi:MAG: fused MFS/spermidine synthase [Chloroflexota bacterium]|nr:fused MFS/spermidine synthase [Chloroflexota bacterium]
MESKAIQDGFVRLIVFLGGLTSIGLELTTSRLLAPYFGGSTFIWANLIGLTLAHLSLGYYLGGRLADRRPSPELLFTITAVAAFAVGLIPLMSRPLLSFSLSAFDDLSVGAFYGSLLGVLLLTGIPTTLLGFVTPFAIRLRLRAVADAGQTAGGIYALSTLGSIAGSFLPVIVLIPLFGTARTFLTLGLALLIPSALALVTLKARLLAILCIVLGIVQIGIATTGSASAIRPADRGRLVYESESEYNYIQVLEEDGAYLLALNEGHAIHSIYDPNQLLTRGPWDYFMAGSLFNPAASTETTKSALLIGLAGGTVARQLTAAYGPIPIDGVEIDPEIVRVGRKYFGMDEPNLNVIVEDGRYFLRTTEQRYDLIGVDAYRQPYIPFQLTSREFFQEVSDRLTPAGVAVINVGRTSTDYRLVDAIASTMTSVYPHVYVIDVERYSNSIVVGASSEASIANFAANASLLPVDSPLRVVADRSLLTGNIREVSPGGTVFTDDRAPVEQVVDQIILNVAREGEDE